MKMLLCLACAALTVGACATDPTQTANADLEKTYRTGSNIPERDRAGVRTMSPEDFERARDAAIGNTGKKPGN